MSKKQESTKDQVVRLYKEGYDLDGVAKIMGLTNGGVRNLLDKYMPDWEHFTQPVLENPSAEDSDKGLKGKLNIPVSNLFKKKKKDEEVKVVKTVAKETNINLEMNENGFVENSVNAIAKMIARGDDEQDIAEFFSRDIADIEAVKACMEKHKLNLEAQPEQTEQSAEEEVFNPFISDKLKRDTNLSKHTNEETEEYVPHIENADDVADEMPSISTDNLVFEEPVKPVATDAIDAIEEAEIPAEPVAETEAVPAAAPVAAAVETKESEAEMSPMEKMKQFAKEQIDINNQKIEVLKVQKNEAQENVLLLEKNLNESKSQLADVGTQISESEAQISQFNAMLTEINAKLTDVRTKLADLQIKEAKLNDESAKTEEETQKANEAAAEIDKSIAEIEKENAEFAEYIK